MNRQDFFRLIENLSGILGQRRGQAQQAGQFGAQMQMQGERMQQQREQFLADLEHRRKTAEETAKYNKAMLGIAQATSEHERWRREQEMEEEALGEQIGEAKAMIAAGDVSRVGPRGEELKIETPADIIGSVSALLTQMGHPEAAAEYMRGIDITKLLPDEDRQLRMATLAYKAAYQTGVAWETLGLDEEYRNAYDIGMTDRERGIRREEAELKALLRGPVGPAPPEPGLVQGRAMANFESIVVKGGDPTDEQWMAAFGYIPETLQEKQDIIFQTIENYKARQSDLIWPKTGG
jgi:hypothetical protein